MNITGRITNKMHRIVLKLTYRHGRFYLNINFHILVHFIGTIDIYNNINSLIMDYVLSHNCLRNHMD